MNQHVPDCNVGNGSIYSKDLPLTNRTLTTGAEDELVELLWQDGHVVMHSQTPRKPPIAVNDIEHVQKPVQGHRSEQSLGNSSSLIQEDNPASWFQYPVDDLLDKEFDSDFFSEMTCLISSGSDKIINDVMADREKLVKFGCNNDVNLGVASDSDQCMIQRNRETPHMPHIIEHPTQTSFLDIDTVKKFPLCSQALNTDLNLMSGQLGKNGSGNWGELVGQQSSLLSVGSNNCASDQIHTHLDPNHNLTIGTSAVVEEGRIGMPSDRIQTTAHESATTSSSGGSGFSIGRTGKQSEDVQNKKRKDKDAEDVECDSEEAELDERLTKKPRQQTKLAHRSRAAEVHNLSERRRRDRINEKMRALQELIPHCNKTDKASMLDEAIEYLKSLQLQLQMMWMGSSMAPVMFPVMQQYISAAMGMGMAYGPLPSMPNPIQSPGVPCLNQTGASASTRNQMFIYPTPPLNAASFPIQAQNAYKGFHHMQPHPQATNSYTNWLFMIQQNNLTDVHSSKPNSSAGGGASTAEITRSG